MNYRNGYRDRRWDTRAGTEPVAFSAWRWEVQAGRAAGRLEGQVAKQFLWAVERAFTAKRGQRVTEAVTRLVTSDGSDCATLTLLAPNGTTVDSNFNCNSVGVGPDALTVSGTYTVRLTLESNTATGTARLNVST